MALPPMRSRGAWHHAPWRASRDPLGSKGLKETNKEGGDRRGEVSAMVGTAAVHGNAVGRPCWVRTRVRLGAHGRGGASGSGLGLELATKRRGGVARGGARAGAKRAAADMEPAAGHGRVQVCARVGSEVCTKQPEEGAPLPCSHVRKAIPHGKAMAVRRAGAQRCGEVRCKRKRTKGPTWTWTSPAKTRVCCGGRLRKGGEPAWARARM
jgi:hypothetical protein